MPLKHFCLNQFTACNIPSTAGEHFYAPADFSRRGHIVLPLFAAADGRYHSTGHSSRRIYFKFGIQIGYGLSIRPIEIGSDSIYIMATRGRFRKNNITL